MEHDQRKLELELRTKLARCHELALEYPDGPTNVNIRRLEGEIRQQLHDLTRGATTGRRENSAKL
jgi:hypothetical protein